MNKYINKVNVILLLVLTIIVIILSYLYTSRNSIGGNSQDLVVQESTKKNSKYFSDMENKYEPVNLSIKLSHNSSTSSDKVVCDGYEYDEIDTGAYYRVCHIYKDNKVVAISHDPTYSCNSCKIYTKTDLYSDGSYIYCSPRDSEYSGTPKDDQLTNAYNDYYKIMNNRTCHLVNSEGKELAKGQDVMYFENSKDYAYCDNDSNNKLGYSTCHYIRNGKEVATFDGGNVGWKSYFLDIYDNGDYAYCNNGTYLKNCYLIRKGKVLARGIYTDNFRVNYGNVSNGVESFSNGYYLYCDKNVWPDDGSNNSTQNCHLYDKNGKHLRDGRYFEVYTDDMYEYCTDKEVCNLVIDNIVTKLPWSMSEVVVKDKYNYSYCLYDRDKDCYDVISGVKSKRESE